MAVVYGFLAGFIFSIPPGPAAYRVLESTSSPMNLLVKVFVADLLVVLSIFLFSQTLSSLIQSSPLKMASGLFLIGFALFSLRQKLRPSSSSIFRITLMNPAVWLGSFAIFQMFSAWISLAFVISLSFGTFSWFLVLSASRTFFTKVWISRLKRFALSIIFLFGTFLFVQGVTASPGDCQRVDSFGQSTRYDCHLNTERGDRVLHVLKQRGSYSAITMAHGYLLATESVNGVLRETLDRFNKELNSIPFPQRQFVEKVVDCYLSHFERSVSNEFKSAVDQFGEGLRRGLARRRQVMPYSRDEIRLAAFGVELAIALEGLQKRLADKPVSTLAELASECGIRMSLSTLNDGLKVIQGGLSKMKMGCIGFVVPSNVSLDGALMHARNLDADLMQTWQDAPTLFLVDEPGYYRYAAVATAGMIYPGGISGFNEHGISVSLHELGTDKNRTRHRAGSAVIGPFLQQRILREASTIDEAVGVIEGSNHFGAWTILVSDSKTDESASIEITGQRTQVARFKRAQPMGQSNHYLGSLMRDQHFTQTFNKTLESASRLSVIRDEMHDHAGNIDVQWMIHQLAGHQDHFEGFRSFGRTATKVYTVKSTVAVPARSEFWLSLGERRPASHSTFAGVFIDWDNWDFEVIGTTRTTEYEAIPNWEDSLESYTLSRMAYRRGALHQAELHLNRAITLAAQDDIEELPYLYIRARLRHQRGEFVQAKRDWDRLFRQRQNLHIHQQTLVRLYRVAAEDKIHRRSIFNNPRERRRELKSIADRFQALNNRWNHEDLRAKRQLALDMRSSPTRYDLPPLDYVTVE